MAFKISDMKATTRLKMWVLAFWNRKRVIIYLILKPRVKI